MGCCHSCLERIIFRLLEKRVARPPHPFDPAEVVAHAGPPPDYSEDSSWASLPFPESQDALGRLAEIRPDDTEKATPVSDRPADCFFVHPTTYFGRAWNGPIEDPKSNEQLQYVLAGQASAFNITCRMYCPRYRQASIASFIYDKSSGRKALEVAYSDVKRAWRHFLSVHNRGRPFVLASHSQGGWHLSRLLEEEIENGPADVRNRMVACYLLGSKLPADKFERSFPSLHASQSPTDTPCAVVGWDTRSKKERLGRLSRHRPGHYYGDRNGWESDSAKTILGTNPFTWTSNVRQANHSLGGRAVLPSTDGVHCGSGGILVLRAEPPFTTLAAFLSPEPSGVQVHGARRCSLSEMYGQPDSPARGDFRLSDATVDENTGYLMIPQPPQPQAPPRSNEFTDDFRRRRTAADFDFERLKPSVEGGYHNYDYALFYFELRNNVRERVKAFLRGAAGEEGSSSPCLERSSAQGRSNEG
jgi:hypothetical protein